jgi:uroporphyrinogen decarboxylase
MATEPAKQIASTVDSEWRIRELLCGRHPDRVPVFPFELRGFAAVDAGQPIADAYRAASSSYAIQIRALELYGFDGFPRYSYGAYGGWELGGDVFFPESEWQQAPTVLKHPAATEEDLMSLVPPTIRRAGCIPIALAFSRMASEHGRSVIPPINGVFTTAANASGVATLCRWTLRRPDLAHKLLRIATDHLKQVVSLWVSTFGRDIWGWTSEPSCSNQVISPHAFEEFVLPYETELHRWMLSLGIRHIMTHICGDQNLNLPLWATVPMGTPGVATFGHEVDIETAIKHMGHSCIIAGNIEPALLQNGTPQEVYEVCVAAIEKGKKAPLGFILMPGCSTPPYASPDNMRAMLQAAVDAGAHDHNGDTDRE